MLEEKYKKLENILRDLGSVAIGFSGGVDSSLLVAVAAKVLENKAVAITVLSPFCPKLEGKEAETLAKNVGIKHILLQLNPLEDERVAKNPPDRCYYCKYGIFSKLQETAAKEGISYVVDGSNSDDNNDYRPGMKAIKELGIKSPLQEAGLTKADIRALSKKLNLPTWNKESAACLASRIPYGEQITKEKLGRVEAAEEYLTKFKFTHLRVRSHGDIARIEVGQEDFSLLGTQEVRNEINDALKKLGFSYVSLDLAGYRVGSLNEVLRKK